MTIIISSSEKPRIFLEVKVIDIDISAGEEERFALCALTPVMPTTEQDRSCRAHNRAGSRSFTASLVIVGTSRGAVKARQVNVRVLAFWNAMVTEVTD
jgi:hypothetical protein